MRAVTTVAAVAALLGVACGGIVEGGQEVPGSGGAPTWMSAGGDTAAGGRWTASGGRGGPPPPAPPPATEPSCPDVPIPAPELECDPYAPAPGGCGIGEACYPDVLPGIGPCEPSTFTATCARAGTALQGQRCEYMDECAGDFVCVGFEGFCARRCDLQTPCPDGLVCEGVVGFVDLGVCE